jgi:hypothetical protein
MQDARCEIVDTRWFIHLAGRHTRSLYSTDHQKPQKPAGRTDFLEKLLPRRFQWNDSSSTELGTRSPLRCCRVSREVGVYVPLFDP